MGFYFEVQSDVTILQHREPVVISLYRAVWTGGLFLKGMTLSLWESSIRRKRTHLAVNSISRPQSCLFNEVDLIRYSTKTELWIRIVPPFQENRLGLSWLCFKAHSIHTVFLFVAVTSECSTPDRFLTSVTIVEAVRLLCFFFYTAAAKWELQPLEVSKNIMCLCWVCQMIYSPKLQRAAFSSLPPAAGVHTEPVHELLNANKTSWSTQMLIM